MCSILLIVDKSLFSPARLEHLRQNCRVSVLTRCTNIFYEIFFSSLGGSVRVIRKKESFTTYFYTQVLLDPLKK